MNLIKDYYTLITRINNFKGAEGYIIDTINRVKSLPRETNLEINSLRDVSSLLVKIAFDMI
jgi:hypothetical protein